MWPAFVMPSREYMISSRDSSIHWLSKKHFALRYMCMSRAIAAVVADATSLSTFYFPFSNEFSDITNWNDFCISDEQKSIVAPSSMHSNCHLFVRVVFTSLSNRNKNSSLNYRWISVKKRQTDSKTATMLNQNEIEANQYMRPLEIFRQIMHFDGINIFRLVIKLHKILIQSASYTRIGSTNYRKIIVIFILYYIILPVSLHRLFNKIRLFALSCLLKNDYLANVDGRGTKRKRVNA